MARILVADDDPQVRGLTSSVLQSAGYEVDTAADGREAFSKLIHNGGYSGLVADGEMHPGSGFELIRKIRDCGSGLPVILLTGNDSKDEEVVGVRDLVSRVVHKPYDVFELPKIVQEYIPLKDIPLSEE